MSKEIEQAIPLNKRISENIYNSARSLAVSTTELHYHKNPELELEYGPHNRAKCEEEVEHYLKTLATAILCQSPGVFSGYIEWSDKIHLARNVPTSILKSNLECLGEVLKQNLPPEMQPVVLDKYLAQGLKVLKGVS